jgi:hypothetical protein
MLLLEKDIYPAFTSGDENQIIKSLESVIDTARKSTGDADALFRLFNWSWPALTSKARTNSENGVKIVGLFSILIQTLLDNCSVDVVPQIGNCKLVIRAILRGLNVIEMSLAVNYLRTVESRVLPLKNIKGFMLDRVAVDHLISFTSDAGDLADAAASLLIKVLRKRRLYNTEQLAEFLSRIVKLHSNSALAATMCRKVLDSHKSRLLYDGLMDRLSFGQVSGSEETSLKRYAILSFLITVMSSGCTGERLPAFLSKSELTTPILNWRSNKLYALFTMRLVRVILQRIEPSREDEVMGVVRDRLVELNSLVPVLKQLLENDENISQRFLMISELLSVVLEYKRALPGSFSDCRFEWAKLLESPSQEPYLNKLLVRFVFSVHKCAVPITNSVSRMFTRIVNSGADDTVLSCIDEWLRSPKCSGRILQCEPETVEAFVYALRKHGMDTVEKVMGIILREVIQNPSRLRERSLLQLLAESNVPELFSVVQKRIAKQKKRKAEAIDEPEFGKPVSDKEQSDKPQLKIPRLSMSNRRKCPPLPSPVADPYDLELSGWATLLFANELSETCEIDLVNVVTGSNRLYSAILALSSEDECVRTSAFEVLAVVLRALAVSIEAKGVETNRFVFREAPQLAMILTWFRNGISGPSIPVPLVSSVFVVEAIKVLVDPRHVVYTALYKHILDRFSMNVYGEVQMWSSLFFSDDAVNLRAFRLWILEIISKGVSRDGVSVSIISRRNIIESLLNAGVHLNSTGEELDLVLDIMNSVLRHQMDDDVDMIDRYAMCQWIQSVTQSRHVKFLDD